MVKAENPRHTTGVKSDDEAVVYVNPTAEKHRHAVLAHPVIEDVLAEVRAVEEPGRRLQVVDALREALSQEWMDTCRQHPNLGVTDYELHEIN